MKSLFRISLTAALLVFAASPGFAMMSIRSVSPSEAKEMGVTLRAKPNGPREVWVELEFKAEGIFKQFSHVSLEVRDGKKFQLGWMPLKEKRSKSGKITVIFLANRAYLDKVSLRIVVGPPLNHSGYDLRVREFLE